MCPENDLLRSEMGLSSCMLIKSITVSSPHPTSILKIFSKSGILFHSVWYKGNLVENLRHSRCEMNCAQVGNNRWKWRYVLGSGIRCCYLENEMYSPLAFFNKEYWGYLLYVLPVLEDEIIEWIISPELKAVQFLVKALRGGCQLKKTLSSSDQMPVLRIFTEIKVRNEITSFIECVRVESGPSFSELIEFISFNNVLV